jgi:hypothetical protein
MKGNKNPIARALRSPHLGHQVVPNKKKYTNRKEMRVNFKQGKYDQ